MLTWVRWAGLGTWDLGPLGPGIGPEKLPAWYTVPVVHLVEEYEDLKIKDQLAGGTLCLVPWWDNVFCSHDWESIVSKSAIHETKIRTTNGREKQGCKRYFGFHSRMGYMRETYLMSTPLGRM